MVDMEKALGLMSVLCDDCKKLLNNPLNMVSPKRLSSKMCNDCRKKVGQYVASNGLKTE